MLFGFIKKNDMKEEDKEKKNEDLLNKKASDLDSDEKKHKEDYIPFISPLMFIKQSFHSNF
jgi:hypothetical protein